MYNSYTIKGQQPATPFNILLVHKLLYNNTINKLLVHVTPKIYNGDVFVGHFFFPIFFVGYFSRVLPEKTSPRNS